MTKKTIKQLMVILVILVLAIYSISGTYARYSGSASGTGSVEVAKWKITVNDVGNKQNMNIQFKQVENKHVVDGKIAPDTQMYADLELDPTGTEVSIDYSFTLGAIETADGVHPKNISVEKVCLLQEGGQDGDTLKHDGSKYYGSILLHDGSTSALTESDKVKVRVYAKWNNDEAENENDSAIARNTENITKYQMKITCEAKQHLVSDDTP